MLKSVAGIIGSPTLLLALLLSNALFVGAHMRSRSMLQELAQEAAQAETARGRSQLDRDALLWQLSQRQLAGMFLQGVNASADTVVSWPQAPDGIYMLLRSTCPACPKNYPVLNELARMNGMLVLGIAPRDEADVLKAHIAEHRVDFPIINQIRGSLLDVLPRYATPMTIVVVDGRVVYLTGGVFDESRSDTLKAMARSTPATTTTSFPKQSVGAERPAEADAAARRPSNE